MCVPPFLLVQIPTGDILPVASTVFDFNSETHTVGERLHQVGAKLLKAGVGPNDPLPVLVASLPKLNSVAA
jgi:hypothetical protein